mgnify:CR=1 FL=1
MERYQKTGKNGSNCGEGTYGVVYMALDKKTGQTVALKVKYFIMMSLYLTIYLYM